MAYDIGPSIGVTGEAEFKAAMASINDEFKLLGSEMKLAVSQFDKNDKSTEALTAQNEVLGKEIDSQKGRIALLTTQYDKQNSTLATLKDKLEATKAAFGADSAEVAKAQKEYDKQNRAVTALQTQLNNATTELNNMERVLKSNNQAIEDNSRNMDELGNNVEATGSKIGALGSAFGALGAEIGGPIEKLTSGLQEILGSESKFTGLKIAIGAIGTAFIGATVAGVKMADDMQGALNKLQTQTGMTDGMMKGMDESIKNIYNSNAGENFQDIATAMGDVGKATGLTGKELENLTQTSLLMRDSFGMETADSIKAADQLMTQFGVTGEEAYQLIASGAQTGMNKNGDLLDIIEEYSVQFKNLGFSADDMFNILNNGAVTGGFSIDVMGDAMKEFSIRTKEESKATSAAFESLGLDAGKLTAAFGQGGEAGKAAFKLVNDALEGVKDPIQQNSIGTALWGTMWEDLGPKAIFALNDTNGELSKTEDNLKKIGELNGATFGATMEGIRRNLMTGLVMPLGEMVLPAMKEFAKWLQENLPAAIAAIKPVFEGLVGVFKLVADNIGIIIPVLSGLAAAFVAQKAVGVVTGLMEAYKAATVATTAVQWLLNAAMAANPFGALALVIAAVVAGGIALWMNWDTIKVKLTALGAFIGTAWESIKSAVLGAVTGIGPAVAAAWEGIKTKVVSVVTGIGGAVVGAWEGMKSAISGAVSAIGSAIQGAWEGIKSFLLGLWDSISTSATTKFDGMKSGISQVTEGIRQFLANIWEAIKLVVLGPVLLLCDLVTGNWTKLKEDSEQLFNKLKEAFSGIWNAIKMIFTGTVDAIKSFLATSWDVIKAGAENIWNGIKAYFENLWNDIKAKSVVAWDSFKSTITTGWKDTVQGAKDIWNGLLTWFTELPSKLQTIGANMFTSMKSGVSSTISGVREAVVSGITGAIDYLTSLPGQALTWGKDMIQGFIDGIKGMMSNLRDIISDIGSAIRSILHFSVPDEGPLTDYESWMPDFMGGLADGIKKSKHLVTDAVKGLASDMSIGVQGSLTGLSALDTRRAGSNSNYGTTNVTKHTGTIRVEGIDSKGQLQSVVDIIIDKLQMEARMV